MLRTEKIDPYGIFTYSELSDLSVRLITLVKQELQAANLEVSDAGPIVRSGIDELVYSNMGLTTFAIGDVFIDYDY